MENETVKSLKLIRRKGRYGFVDETGALVIHCQYRKALGFKNGVAMVSDESGSWGAINGQNEIVEPIIYGRKELYQKLYVTIHLLKILPEYYQAILKGEKRFEVRFNDRNYKKGDFLYLREHDGKDYTGHAISVEVTYLLDNPDYCKENFVIMSIRRRKFVSPIDREPIRF